MKVAPGIPTPRMLLNKGLRGGKRQASLPPILTGVWPSSEELLGWRKHRGGSQASPKGSDGTLRGKELRGL